VVVFASLGAHSFMTMESAREFFETDVKRSVDWRLLLKISGSDPATFSQTKYTCIRLDYYLAHVLFTVVSDRSQPTWC
jgi:hypothetical protein